MSETVSEYDELLVFAYRGEVFGDALFGAMAAVQPDPERREKLETLQTVEARTATTLRRLMSDAHLHADDDAAREEGRKLAASIDPESWDGFVKGLNDALPEFLTKFERLREVSSTPNDPALTALLNHERAIQRFAELEVAGKADASLKPLQDHLRRPA